MKYIIHSAQLINSKRISMEYLGKIYNQRCALPNDKDSGQILLEFVYIK